MALHSLMNAGSKVAESKAREEAERQVAATRARERESLFKDCAAEMLAIRQRLFSQIRAVAESAAMDGRGTLHLGDAKLNLKDPLQMSVNLAAPLAQAYGNLDWDFVAWSRVSVTCTPKIGRHQHLRAGESYTWAASLLFVDRKDGQGFRWYEVAFWSLATQKTHDEPFALDAPARDLFLALAPIMHTVQIAYGPIPIDGEDEHAFAERWLQLVSKAAVGSLQRPSYMPINLDMLLSA